MEKYWGSGGTAPHNGGAKIVKIKRYVSIREAIYFFQNLIL
jgi:hypothetical protein